MKKFIIFCFIFLIPISLNASTSDVPGSKNYSIYLNDIDKNDIYDIELTWGDMEFIYEEESEYIYNNSTHEYDICNSYEWSSSDNKIKVKSLGKTISVELKYNTFSDYSSISGEFDIDKFTVSKNETKESKFSLIGELNSDISEFTNIGRITILVK